MNAPLICLLLCTQYRYVWKLFADCSQLLKYFAVDKFLMRKGRVLSVVSVTPFSFIIESSSYPLRALIP